MNGRLGPTLQRFADEIAGAVVTRCGGSVRFDAGAPTTPYAPLVGPAGRTDAQRIAMAEATTIVLFDDSELGHVVDAVRPDARIVVCDVPRVSRDPDAATFTAPTVPARAAAAVRTVKDDQFDGLPKVGWIWGAGISPLLDALTAWDDGRAVVALPGTTCHPLLQRGGVLLARTVLEAVEATRFLQSTPALAHILAIRGGRHAAGQPTLDEVCERVCEASLLAAGMDPTRLA